MTRAVSESAAWLAIVHWAAPNVGDGDAYFLTHVNTA